MKFKLILFFSILFSYTFAQSTHRAHVFKTSEKITIDGKLDEQVWKDTPVSVDSFITMRPIPGKLESQPTEVKIVYDDASIYIAAYMYEPSKDSVMTELVNRDRVGNTDFFGVNFDTYQSGNTGFEFILQSTGVQFDAKVTPNNEDQSWDAVWYGEARVTDNGWYAEMEIPYSALRFPNQKEQEWNINFFRRRAVNGEQSNWKEVDLKLDNAFLTQMGSLIGIRDIKPPVRLSLSPYAAVYGILNHDKNQDPVNAFGSSYNVGMDVKYGINDAFTLDMTLIPDFGQVRSDDQVLNLSPVEIRFQENRAFFTEGTELFNKGGIFYSRRVGNGKQLYNATKVSGRTKKGLGIGFFNAVEAKESETYLDLESGEQKEEVTNPLTNYNITVFDKELKNNSFVTFTNTSVLRFDENFHNANVTGIRYNLKNKDQSYGINGVTAYSVKDHKADPSVKGHYTDVAFRKLKGNFTYNVYYEETDKDYDSNDLGFLRVDNYRTTGINLTYRDLDGFGKFNNTGYWFGSYYSRNIVPDAYTDFSLNWGAWAQTKSFWDFDFWMNYRAESNDFNEPRVEGRHFEIPSNVQAGYWFGSDGRKKIQVSNYGNFASYFNDDWKRYTLGGSIRYRHSDKINVNLNVSSNRNINTKGFVTIVEDNDIVFGKRNQNVISNVLDFNYIMTNRMGLNFRARHYWTKVFYKEYYDLHVNGSLQNKDYDNSHDLSFSAFTIDLIYRWRFAPGSEMKIVWKNNISGAHIDELTDYSQLKYSRGVERLGTFPQRNSISVSFVYFIDYSRDIKRWLK